MQKNLEIVKGKLMDAGIEGAFYENLEKVYDSVSKLSEKNKNKHFELQNKILYGSLSVSIVNIAASVVAAYSVVDMFAPILSGVASIVSVLVTLYIGQKNSGKYCETWLRHQNHKTNLQFEIMDYAYGNDKYSVGDEQQLAHQFIENILKINKNNQKSFEKNMKNFDVNE